MTSSPTLHPYTRAARLPCPPRQAGASSRRPGAPPSMSRRRRRRLPSGCTHGEAHLRRRVPPWLHRGQPVSASFAGSSAARDPRARSRVADDAGVAPVRIDVAAPTSKRRWMHRRPDRHPSSTSSTGQPFPEPGRLPRSPVVLGARGLGVSSPGGRRHPRAGGESGSAAPSGAASCDDRADVGPHRVPG